jgi:hypothetical protein
MPSFGALEEALGRSLTATEMDKVKALAVQDWTGWLDGAEVLPYEVALARMRMLVPGLLPDVPTEAVLTACFGLNAALARKLRREFIGERPRRLQLLKNALKGKDTEQRGGLDYVIVEIPDYLSADLDERAEKAAQQMQASFVSPTKRYPRPRPGFYDWAIEKDTLAKIKTLLK